MILNEFEHIYIHFDLDGANNFKTDHQNLYNRTVVDLLKLSSIEELITLVKTCFTNILSKRLQITKRFGNFLKNYTFNLILNFEYNAILTCDCNSNFEKYSPYQYFDLQVQYIQENNTNFSENINSLYNLNLITYPNYLPIIQQTLIKFIRNVIMKPENGHALNLSINKIYINSTKQNTWFYYDIFKINFYDKLIKFDESKDPNLTYIELYKELYTFNELLTISNKCIKEFKIPTNIVDSLIKGTIFQNDTLQLALRTLLINIHKKFIETYDFVIDQNLIEKWEYDAKQNLKSNKLIS
jgi:hypothetical protein